MLVKQKIYIDTSVVGGYFDEEFKEATTALFQRLENEEIIFVVSDLLDLELINAPQKVRELLHNYSANKFFRVELTEEAIKLADSYISENVVGKTSLVDCRHIALATINKVDVLASWNFKHIVNLDRIKGYNSVNYKLGYQMIEIRSPKDLVNYGKD
jgi:predicted nucleic acid-binding protein